MNAYIDAGGNSLDTADVYAGGASEEIIGRYLSCISRDRIIIASKCYFPVENRPNSFGVSRKHVTVSCEGSLRRLNTDYIDLYYVHGPDPITPWEETMRALDDLVRQGKVPYLGCSNIFGWQIPKANGIAGEFRTERLVACQYLYNLIHREPEREIVPAAVDQGLGILPYSPLAGGLLTGKYTGMTDPAPRTRLSFRTQVDGPRFWHQKGFRRVEILDNVAAETEIPAWKLAIAWPLKPAFVTSVILGVRTVEQLAKNMELADWDIPEDIWNILEERTRAEEDDLTWFTKRNYERFFSLAEFHDKGKELP